MGVRMGGFGLNGWLSAFLLVIIVIAFVLRFITSPREVLTGLRKLIPLKLIHRGMDDSFAPGLIAMGIGAFFGLVLWIIGWLSGYPLLVKIGVGFWLLTPVALLYLCVVAVGLAMEDAFRPIRRKKDYPNKFVPPPPGKDDAP